MRIQFDSGQPNLMEIKASTFTTREELDQHVRSLPSTEEHTISGTTEELARLHLSHTTIVFGVPCTVSDFVPKEPQERPYRGEVQPFGLDEARRDEAGNAL